MNSLHALAPRQVNLTLCQHQLVTPQKRHVSFNDEQVLPACNIQNYTSQSAAERRRTTPTKKIKLKCIGKFIQNDTIKMQQKEQKDTIKIKKKCVKTLHDQIPTQDATVAKPKRLQIKNFNSRTQTNVKSRPIQALLPKKTQRNKAKLESLHQLFRSLENTPEKHTQSHIKPVLTVYKSAKKNQNEANNKTVNQSAITNGKKTSRVSMVPSIVQAYSRLSINLNPQNAHTRISAIKSRSASRSLKKSDSWHKQLNLSKQSVMLQQKYEQALLKLKTYSFVEEYVSQREQLQMFRGYAVGGEPECRWTVLVTDLAFQRMRQAGIFGQAPIR